MRALATAAVLAAGLVFGCGDDGGTSLPADATPGQRVFAETGCGSCHTLAAAGSTGQAGGSLDDKRPDVATVERWVREGGKGMPAYDDQLSAVQVREVSRWVAEVAGR